MRKSLAGSSKFLVEIVAEKLLRDPSDQDKLGFHYVKDGGTPIRAIPDNNGKTVGYSASMACSLENVPGFTIGPTTTYELGYDSQAKAFCFYLGTGKVMARKKKSKAADEVKAVPEASAASPEPENGVAEDVGAEEADA